MSRPGQHQQGITAPQGFRASAVAAGIKPSGQKDLVLLVSDYPACAAGLFTTNQLAAAPVRLSQTHLQASPFHQAVIINSGSANACTGRVGLIEAQKVCQGLARLLRCRPQEVLMASTGVIGTRLPLKKILPALPRAIARLSSRQGLQAAQGIMTTDTIPKQAETCLNLQGTKVRLGGMAKGAGMIHPQMATLLAFITTDACLNRSEAHHFLQTACSSTFNAISIDGQNSTNDTLLLLANGTAGLRSQPLQSTARLKFLHALTEVMDALADAIVRDGEGASKWIEIIVSGAATGEEAKRGAQAIANSPLVKTAVQGADANWGRILQALGATTIRLHPAKIYVSINGVVLVRQGVDAGIPWSKANQTLRAAEVRIHVALGVGKGQARYRTCDLTSRYIKINAGYRN